MKNPPSGLLPLPVNSQDTNSQKTVSAGVKIKTSLKRTIANTDNISKKLRRSSRATKSSSPSMEKMNEVQSSLDKVQKNQTKIDQKHDKEKHRFLKVPGGARREGTWGAGGKNPAAGAPILARLQLEN